MEEKKKPKFLRRTSKRYVKLGKGVKKNQKWRKPTGRDNKMREKKKGYPAVVKIGYKAEKASRGVLNNKKPIMILNVKDLENVKKNTIAIIGKVGKKKKLEIAKKAKEMKVELYNMNAKNYLKLNEKKRKEDKKVAPKGVPSNEGKVKKDSKDKPKEATLKGTSKK